MVKFNLHIFRSCRTKNTSTLPEHSSPPCQRYNVSNNHSTAKNFQKNVVNKFHDIDSPRRKIYNSFSTSCNDDFQIPIMPMPSFYKRKNHSIRKVKSNKPHECDDNKEERSRHYDERDGEGSPEWGSPARLSLFKKLLPCKVEGKVKESFAVVKRSENPYEDFKKSMTEMIVENQMYEESDLKQLLQCFLSLNSRYHHGMIMEAFLEIWHAIMFLNHSTLNV